LNIPFLRDDSAIHGQIQHVAPGVRRLLCNNPGPFTWRGTNTWIIGEGEVAVLDPGPEDPAHLEAMLRALDGEVVSHIIISHTHRDHSPGAAGLAAATGAPTYGFGPHMTAGAGGDEAFEVLRSVNVLAAHGEKVEKTPHLCGPNMHANVEEARRYSFADNSTALTRQTQIYRNFQKFFAEHSVLISPAICCSPRPWRELYPAEIDGKPVRSYFHWLSLAYYVTLTGHPAMSLPVGLDEKGFPFGLQIVGPRGGDAVVLQVAAAIEAAFAGDAEFGRPLPDLAALAKARPISEMEAFKTWD
jgi:hypothetical protein